MRKLLRNAVKRLAHRLGYDIVRRYRVMGDDEKDREIIRSVKLYTMTSPDRLSALIRAVKYVVKNDIPGDIVECGVWRGGSMMAAAKALVNLGRSDRELYLFDTFEGMTSPSQVDIDFTGAKASEILDRAPRRDGGSVLAYAPLDEVKEAMYQTGYDRDRIHFVKGRVEDTIPNRALRTISLLRLDTDWYESTRHELIHLFPRLSCRGVVIIDDYGYWLGQRKAVDDYLAEKGICLLLNAVDASGRIGVKV